MVHGVKPFCFFVPLQQGEVQYHKAAEFVFVTASQVAQQYEDEGRYDFPCFINRPAVQAVNRGFPHEISAPTGSVPIHQKIYHRGFECSIGFAADINHPLSPT